MEEINKTDITRRVVIDIEADSLNPTVIWCIVCKDIDTKEIFKFRPNTPLGGHKEFINEFLEFIKTVRIFIGHNIVAFDIPNINRLFGCNIQIDMCVDTLVLSRLFRPVSPFKEDAEKLKAKGVYPRTFGHSLEAWGVWLGFPKISFSDFSKFTEVMLEYCVNDVELNERVYFELKKESAGFSEYSIRLEHDAADLLATQERNGFYLDIEKAEKFKKSVQETLSEMSLALQQIFPPLPKLVQRHTVRYTKTGEVNKVSQRILETYRNTPGLSLKPVEGDIDSVDLFMEEAFNPKSPKQIAERLLALDWKPKKFTEKGAPKTDKETLVEAVDELLQEYPEHKQLKCLADFNIVDDRLQKVTKWLELVEEDGYVHGRINPIGAGTHRCSHYNDNMANIAAVAVKRLTRDKLKAQEPSLEIETLKKYDVLPDGNIFLKAKDEEVEVALTGIPGGYGWESRSCWSVPRNTEVLADGANFYSRNDFCLVGADASGIQLRALAHYMNDPEYIKQLISGDIHVVNQKAAGIETRATAKTFIYAWLLGAGDEKIGTICGLKPEEMDELQDFAERRKRWDTDLLTYFMTNLRKQNRRADRRTVLTIVKGFKTKEQFLDRIPALKHFRKEVIPEAAKQGFMIGLDGRKLWIPNEHLAMSLYLQGFEAVIMKEAMRRYSQELKSLGVYFKQVAFVHDEFQIETRKEHAEIVGKTVVKSIKEAGEVFGSNCPLDGEYKVGQNWAQTH